MPDDQDEDKIDNEVGLSALNAPAARQALRDAFMEIGIQLDAAVEAKDAVNDILDAAAAKFNLKKPLLRRVAKMYWKNDGMAFTAQASEITELYRRATQV